MPLDQVRIEIEEDTPQDLIRQIAFWQSLPSKCPRCGHNLRFHFRRAGDKQQYKFYELLCTNPDEWHKASIHEHADNSGMFWKWDEKFIGWKEIKARAAGDDIPEHRDVAPEDADAYENKLEEARSIFQEAENEKVLSKQILAAWRANFKTATTLKKLEKCLAEFTEAVVGGRIKKREREAKKGK
jgi:hypothetical protein